MRQDLELIDNDLPMAITQTIFEFLSAIFTAVLVFIGSGYIAATTPLCMLALFLIQFYYLRTSRQLRLLDIEAKAPLFSQFLETISGISSIRAYGWTEDYIQRNCQALNTSQKPYYLLWCIQRWLTLVLDLLNTGIAILLVSLATNLRTGSTTFLGTALFNVVIFSATLQTFVTQWTEVETALGAISRIRSYVNTVQDENLANEVNNVPTDWPAHGSITLKDLSASYESSAEPVLKEISLSVNAGEKVAICGRTGSGKSSLIAALLRIVEIDSGTMSIDGIDISTIPRDEVRRRINTLSQDPFFLPGSVRENLDPLQTASDDRMIEALRVVCIWDFFHSRGGLDSDMREDQLSQGQRKLFCLARAVIRPGKILIMDEAMSGVDSETEELMQKVIRREFRDRTIIEIVHKLYTVLDYDRVILLDEGRIIEQGMSGELAMRSTSAFYTE
ncbi:ABC transporter FUM19 [Lachnellula cervina]|uniref:ABC transporter FUM19 n=1 Tax=Lachnellula cervina TaxID=1316786 RepID=A0A7D8YIL2_9HELO|nr:ABC transporter FUM19 [Lachnellula cervina]